MIREELRTTLEGFWVPFIQVDDGCNDLSLKWYLNASWMQITVP
jgi:hypothetical protein